MPKIPFLASVIKRFTDVAVSQEEKGLEKYGQGLDPMDFRWDWLQMAEEELVDAAKYMMAERDRRDAVLRDVLNDLHEVMDARPHPLLLVIRAKLDTLARIK